MKHMGDATNDGLPLCGGRMAEGDSAASDIPSTECVRCLWRAARTEVGLLVQTLSRLETVGAPVVVLPKRSK